MGIVTSTWTTNTMKLSVFVLLACCCLSVGYSLSLDTRGSCASGWNKHGRYCYKYFGDKLKWQDAQDKCKSMGGFLPEILTKDDDDFIKKMVTDEDHSIWLGADDNKENGKMVWATSGKLVSDGFEDWAPGQPDDDGGKDGSENCMMFSVKSGGWNDDQCDDKHRLVCQAPTGAVVG